MPDMAMVETLHTLRQYLVPKDRADIFNTAKNADTNFFDSNLTTVVSTPTIFRIYVCLDTAAILTVKRTESGVTVSEKLNSGAALTANCGYLFDVYMNGGEEFNLQASENVTIIKCGIYEVPMGQ